MTGRLSQTIAGAVIPIDVLIWWERRVADPLLPIPLLRNPTIWRSDALAACQGAMLVSLVTFLPIYLRVVHGASPGTIGLLLLPITAGIAIGSLLTGWAVSRTGRTAVFPSFGVILAVVTLAAVAVWSPYLDMVQVSWLFGLAAVFMGTVMSVVQITVQSAAGPAMLGTAAASVQFSRSLGASLGTAAVGTVLFAMVAAADPEAARLLEELLQRGPEVLASLPAARQITIRAEIADAFRAAFLTVAAFGLMGIALAWTIPLRRI